MVVATKFGFGMRGEDISTRHSRLLNENHLVRFMNEMLVFIICSLLIIKNEKRKNRNRFFIRVSDETLSLALTHSQVWWKTQGYIVLGSKCLCVGRFKRNVLSHIQKESIVCYPKHEEVNIDSTSDG